MRIVEDDEIHRALPYEELIEALRRTFLSGCEAPVRQHHDLGGGTLLIMPAWQPGGPIGVKIVTVFPDNARRALPSVLGSFLLLDGDSGLPLAMLDAPALTLRRTAAASALAADYLARRDSASHLMVGTGALAPHLIAAHRAMRPIRETRIWGRDPAKAVALARRLSEEGCPAAPAGELEQAVAAADIVTCATLAREPLIRGRWLCPGTHLDLVGGYTPQMREADDEAVRRATVYVDTRAGAGAEAGDIVQPLRSGALAADGIAGDLFELTRGAAPGRRSPEEITFFKSVGTALEDLAAARLALSRLG